MLAFSFSFFLIHPAKSDMFSASRKMVLQFPISNCLLYLFFLLISSTTVAPEALDTVQARGYNHSIIVICLVAHYRTCCRVQNLNIPIFLDEIRALNHQSTSRFLHPLLIISVRKIL